MICIILSLDHFLSIYSTWWEGRCFYVRNEIQIGEGYPHSFLPLVGSGLLYMDMGWANPTWSHPITSSAPLTLCFTKGGGSNRMTNILWSPTKSGYGVARFALSCWFNNNGIQKFSLSLVQTSSTNTAPPVISATYVMGLYLKNLKRTPYSYECCMR